MSKKKRVVDIVEEIALPIVEEKGLELVDVEFVKEGPYRYLRVTIDKEEGISVDDCQEVSRAINASLDAVDPIEENYFLEVTSPGIERVLKKDDDFNKFKGKMVQINLYKPYEGQKVLIGELKGINDSVVKLVVNNEEIKIAKSQISLAKLYVNFDEQEEK